MANEIKHSWVGSVLTITSDSGTSSANLQGPKGDMGPRGPQGPAGVVYDAEGNIIMEGYATEQFVVDLYGGIDLTPYATETYVNETVAEAVGNVDLADYATKAYVDAAVENADLDDYATKEYVDTQIVNVATGGTIDLGNYATKSYVDNATAPVDNETIKINNKGKLSTVIGGGYKDYDMVISPNANGTITLKDTDPANLIPGEIDISFICRYSDGYIDALTGKTRAGVATFNDGLWSLQDAVAHGSRVKDLLFMSNKSTNADGETIYRQTLIFGFQDGYESGTLVDIGVIFNEQTTTPSGVITIDPSFIPIDNETIIIQNGKLTVVGGATIPSSEEVSY